MPREGVPYPSREICSLKCQIDALNAKINELMKSINGVQGDGQGNVSLVSGDPAVVINNDASQNQIEIALDPSELPNAPVRSVNGLTGDVQLAAGNIPMYSGQPMSVQNQVAANEGMISILQSNLNQEVLDRGNADSALQTNVNGIGARVSVIEGQISEDPDPNTIGLRDANGRLKAEDPASGATDKTLVTANWVSQSGNASPNNIMHKNGSENFSGIKKALGSGYIRKVSSSLNLSAPPASGTITDENYVMEDVNGTTAVQLFNSYTANSQTIFQIATKYPFVENGVVKNTNGILWLTAYNDHVSLYLRFVDKNGTSHMSEIARVTQ